MKKSIIVLFISVFCTCLYGENKWIPLTLDNQITVKVDKEVLEKDIQNGHRMDEIRSYIEDELMMIMKSLNDEFIDYKVVSDSKSNKVMATSYNRLKYQSTTPYISWTLEIIDYNNNDYIVVVMPKLYNWVDKNGYVKASYKYNIKNINLLNTK